MTKEDNLKYQQFKHYAPPFVLPTSREAETRMLCFALRNLGAPFNEFAYKLKSILPLTPGVQFYSEAENHVHAAELPKQTYFCSQLCILLMQAAAHEHLRMQKCSQSIVHDETKDSWAHIVVSYHATRYTPNSTFIMLSAMPDVKWDYSRPDQNFSSIGKL